VSQVEIGSQGPRVRIVQNSSDCRTPEVAALIRAMKALAAAIDADE
jgi:hypothetical protein